MDIGSVLILAGVAVLAAAFVARPLAERRPARQAPADPRSSAVQAELDRVMAMIQELDMDFAMEKIDREVHQSQRSALTARGAALLRERDELSGRVTGKSRGDSLEAAIEAEVSRLRGPSATPAGFCGRCGQPALAGDRFCVHCGAALTVQGSPA